jgi:hypothetical protein
LSIGLAALAALEYLLEMKIRPRPKALMQRAHGERSNVHRQCSLSNVHRLSKVELTFKFVQDSLYAN